MLVKKPNGDLVEVTARAFELIYKEKGFTVADQDPCTGTKASKMTVAELKEALDDKGIEYDAGALKADLVAVYEGAGCGD